MQIAGKYSFNNGEGAIQRKYSTLFKEVCSIIESVDANSCKTKESKEKTMMGQLLFSPTELNKLFKALFLGKAWAPVRVPCEYSTEFYVEGYTPKTLNRGASREMDFVKETLGIEVQFGKYAFMVYNVAAKMTIFKNLGHIDTGIEIVPIKSFADEMSSGVSYFEQFVWDLEKRGTSNIDVPVLVLGVDA
jgi:hypothetical protein